MAGVTLTQYTALFSRAMGPSKAHAASDPPHEGVHAAGQGVSVTTFYP